MFFGNKGLHLSIMPQKWRNTFTSISMLLGANVDWVVFLKVTEISSVAERARYKQNKKNVHDKHSNTTKQTNTENMLNTARVTRVKLLYTQSVAASRWTWTVMFVGDAEKWWTCGAHLFCGHWWVSRTLKLLSTFKNSDDFIIIWISK